jgi:2-haloacid dehalogenase
MRQNMDTGVSTVMFDFYGTVVDMQGGLIEAISPYLAEKGYTANPASRVVTWWRRTHFENSMIDALLHREHTPYREIGRQAVDSTLERAGIAHTMREVDALVAQIEQLRPFGDVVSGLQTLKDHGLRLVVLSNGDPDMLERGVAYSGTSRTSPRPSCSTYAPTRCASWPTTRSTASAPRPPVCAPPSSTGAGARSATTRTRRMPWWPTSLN